VLYSDSLKWPQSHTLRKLSQVGGPGLRTLGLQLWDCHVPIRQGPEALSEDRPADDMAGGPPPPAFSRWTTAVAAAFLIATISFFVMLHLKIPLLERVEAPEQALALMVGRTLDLEEALPQAAPWERLLYELSMETGADELEQAITWYQELAGYSRDPVVSLHLAILEAEGGHLERLRARLPRWLRDHEPLPTFATWLQSAYVEQRVPVERERLMQAELAETLSEGWFYDKLAFRLATRAADRQMMAAASQSLLRRATLMLERMRVLLLLELVLVLGGLVAFGAASRSMAFQSWRIGTAAVPPNWTVSLGAMVLVRGGALAAVVTMLFFLGDLVDPPLRLLAMPLINLPVILLAHRYLMVPYGHRLRDALGLKLLPSGWRRLMLVTLMLVSAGFAGEWLIGVLADSFRWSSHWTEWFDSDLVWGTSDAVATAVTEYVVFAPLFEELAFRGLLFATLRRRFGFVVSALASATLFGLAHGYGLLGFLSVLWSGLLWAWAYEKVGSLWPVIAAHAVNNLLICLTIIWMLRL
jgi:membrane protease YdiL (CAAX protease family)